MTDLVQCQQLSLRFATISDAVSGFLNALFALQYRSGVLGAWQGRRCFDPKAERALFDAYNWAIPAERTTARPAF